MFTMKDYLVEAERRQSEIAAAEADRLRRGVARQEALRSTRVWVRLAAHLSPRPRPLARPTGSSLRGAAGSA